MADDIKEKVLHIFDLLDKKMINTRIARSVTAEIFETGKTAEDIIINRPLKPCCQTMFYDQLVMKLVKEYPVLFDTFFQSPEGNMERIITAAKQMTNGQCVEANVSAAVTQYFLKQRTDENVESKS